MTLVILHLAVPMRFAITANVVVPQNIPKETLIKPVAQNVASILIVQDICLASEINVLTHALEFVEQTQFVKFSITSQLAIVLQECLEMHSLNVDLINVCL